LNAISKNSKQKQEKEKEKTKQKKRRRSLPGPQPTKSAQSPAQHRILFCFYETEEEVIVFLPSSAACSTRRWWSHVAVVDKSEVGRQKSSQSLIEDQPRPLPVGM
jgi:hypothetical protein